MSIKLNKRKKHSKHKKHSSKQLELFIETYSNKIIPVLFKRLSDADGVCYNPLGKNSRIIIDHRLLTKRRLNVLIEEVTHAFFWDEPEYKVRKFSAQLGKLIHHLFLKK